MNAMKVSNLSLVILFSYVFLICERVSCEDGELQAVLVVFRHGDRSPKESYPTDPYFDSSYWPMGYGQLTNIGINHQNELGKWFRNRYTSFLPEEYSPNDTYVFSTDKDRTLMSAYANLAGLYPPKGEQIWNADLLWQPIPVHTTPREVDTIFTDKRPCEKYDELLDKVENSDYFTEYSKNYSSVLERLSDLTGWKIKNVKKVRKIQSTISSYESFNKSFVPSWYSEDPELQAVISYLSGVASERETHKKKMKRFRAGPFLYNLISFFEKSINQTEGTPKFYMLSAHDTSLVNILNTMGLFDFTSPVFAASLIFELKSNPDSSHYLNILYKRGSELEKLTIDGCGFNCNFGKFKEILDYFIIDISTFEDKCKNDGIDYS